MDILAYDYILEGLKQFNTKIDQNYGNVIYSEPPTFGKNKTISYPITIFEENTNTANAQYNSCHDKVSSLSYVVDIYAKSKGNITKKTIARKIAKEIDTYLTEYVGLVRVGFMSDGLLGDGSLHRIVMTYSGNLHENRRKFI